LPTETKSEFRGSIAAVRLLHRQCDGSCAAIGVVAHKPAQQVTRRAAVGKIIGADIGAESTDRGGKRAVDITARGKRRAVALALVEAQVECGGAALAECVIGVMQD